MMTSTGRRTALLTAGPALIVVLVAMAVLWSNHAAIVADRLVVHTQDVQLHLSRALQRLTDGETGQRGYLVTGDARYLEPYRGAASDVRQELNTLRQLTMDNADQTRRIGVLSGIVERKFTELDSTIALRRTAGFGRAAAVVKTDRGSILMDSARAVATAIGDEESGLLAQRRRSVEFQRTLAATTVVVGTALIAIIGILVHTLIESQRESLAEHNVQLRDQAAALEEQAVELEQQASEMEMGNAELAAQNEELELAMADLDVARRDAEFANEAKARFLATMSHELRTPLNAISGYVDLMLAGIRGPVTSQQYADLDRIRRAGVHLLGLINDVLNFAKLEAGQVEFAESTVDVCEALRGATMLIEPLAVAKNIALEEPRPDLPPLQVYADRDKLVQIVLNLLSNAIKFTNTGGSVVVTCQPAVADTMVDVIVRDTGRGIAADQLKTVFEPFVQVGRVRLENDSGVGLGLTISRELARRMGGDIIAVSTEGVGSTFTLRLRRVATTLPAVG